MLYKSHLDKRKVLSVKCVHQYDEYSAPAAWYYIQDNFQFERNAPKARVRILSFIRKEKLELKVHSNVFCASWVTGNTFFQVSMNFS